MAKFFLDKNKKISHFGDMNKDYAGSVVKALASAKHGSREIIEALKDSQPNGIDIKQINEFLRSTIISVEKIAPKIIEIIVKSPLAAKNFKPGQFYKLQNFETTARHKKQTFPHYIEPLALTGSWVDKEEGIISLIVLQMGTSSYFCEHLSVGEDIVLMGPTGMPTEIPTNKKVLLLGGGLGNAVLFSIAQALKKNNCKIYYFAAYKTIESIFKKEKVEEFSDKVFWIFEEKELSNIREQDVTFKGNIVQAMNAYIHDIADVKYMMAIGSDRMMAAVAHARFQTLVDDFKHKPPLIGSINSPMQCMMKGICGQCIQVRKNPKTNEDDIIFTCAEQDQDLKMIDFNCLHNRLEQNTLMEKLINSNFI